MNQMITVMRGALSDTEAEVLVNVIANNSRNLADCGVVASSMLKAGGQELQEYYEAQPQPKEFGKDVAITKACGRLQAMSVYHAAVRNYVDHMSEKLLYNMICKCLDLAESQCQTTIAFPTVGCGKLGYNPTAVAECFKRAVSDTPRRVHVYIVAFDTDTFNCFNYVIKSQTDSPACYSEESEWAERKAGANLWSESTLRGVAKPTALGVVPPQPQRVKSKVEEHDTFNEVSVYIRKLFPNMADNEFRALTDHLTVGLGIDQLAHMRMLKEKDLEGVMKPVRMRVLLDAIATEPTKQTAISQSRYNPIQDSDSAETAGDFRQSKAHPRDAAESGARSARSRSRDHSPAKEEQLLPDELDDFLEDTFPKMTDVERGKLKERLYDVGIRELSDLVHMRESDLEGSIKPIYLRKLLDCVAALQNQRSGLSRPGLDANLKRAINILLLGETGVGKSTWINGLINYLTYDTMAEAQKANILCLIPTSFTMTDENFQQREIKWGDFDSNEKQHAGQSATQGAKTYTFKMPDVVLRIIDTPGIGDTRGIEKDKENMENIMSHLSQFKEIHGICILLKPNNARLTVMFEFCVKELLTNLHKDACANMVVCFTNARSTFYRPGDTMPALQKLLANSNTVPINLSKDTVYCMDNEAVRFLAAVKNGVKFDDKEISNFEASWKKSVDETLRLVTHIGGLQPHNVDRTLSLNNARKSILKLSRPIGEISKLIQDNIDVVNDKAKEMLSADMGKKELQQRLYIPGIDLEAIPLKEPCTVCSAPKCTKFIKIGEITKTEYVKRCHPGCKLSGFDTNRINTAALQRCSAMQPSGVTCSVCGCSWDLHMHVNYETRQVKKDVIDESVKLQIDDKESKIKAIEEHKAGLEKKVKELEDEKVQIAKLSAQFACFLKANAIAPYNDAVKAYLEHLISVEEGKVSARGDRKTLEGLETMRNVYDAEIEALEKAMSDKSSQCVDLDPRDIQNKIELLYNLPFAGPQLKQMMSVVDNCAASAAANSEKAVEVKTKSLRDHLRKGGQYIYKGGQWLYNKVAG